MAGSLRLGRIAGIPVLVHWSLALIGLLIAFNLAHAVSPTRELTPSAIATAVIAAVVFFASVLAHELAHALTARRYDVGTESITLWGFGGMAQLSAEPPTARSQGWIALAGPVASLVLGVATLGAAVALRDSSLPRDAITILGWLGVINILLAVFNLLPGAPLDGGRIVAAWRWGRHGDRYLAMEEAAVAGQWVGWITAGVGIWMLLSGGEGLFIALTGGFIALNATAERSGAKARRRLAGLLVSDLAWYGIARATRETDAETMLWQRSRLGLPGIVAIEDGAGDLEGIVAEEQLWKVPESRRSTTHLGQLQVPIQRIAKAAPDEQVTTALARLSPAAPILTVWRDGRLVGVVTPDSLRHHLGGSW